MTIPYDYDYVFEQITGHRTKNYKNNFLKKKSENL